MRYSWFSMARLVPTRRAMSFLEVTLVVAIAGVLAAAAITSIDGRTLSNSGGAGLARELALALGHARRATIATGDNHYLQLSSSGGSVTSYALFRRTSGGNIQVDSSRSVSADVMVNSSHVQLEFDFDGSALAGYSVDVASTDRNWNLTVTTLTGSVLLTEVTP